MKRLLTVMLSVSVLLSACRLSATEAPTAAPAPPTETPRPTEPPPPTDTPTPVFTATPDAAATVAAQATAGAAGVFDELNKLLADSDVPYKDGHLLWQQTDPITITMQGPSADDTTAVIDEDLTAGDFVFKSDVTWTASGWMYCGAIVRSEDNLDDGKQYQLYFLRFSGLPAWYIDVFNGKNYLGSVTGEQFSSVIDVDNEATNQFVLMAQGNKFTVYFNSENQGSYLDYKEQRSEGQFGFMAWQESGKGSCKFENSWIWSLDK
ncbi:MAG: hypothetical protein IT313_08640 [Anaerolineales bacterium]|nr:hypothetical protein [Anaerolineales bacterium]